MLDGGALGLLDGVGDVDFAGRGLDQGGVGEATLLELGLLDCFAAGPSLAFIGGDGDAELVTASFGVVECDDPSSVGEDCDCDAAAWVGEACIGRDGPGLAFVAGEAGEKSIGRSAAIAHEGEEGAIFSSSQGGLDVA